MKVIVTGASGLLGWDIADVLEEQGHTVVRLLGRRSVNILDTAALLDFVKSQQPDIIVHSAGYRDLDDMEDNEADGFALNSFGTKNIALACRATGSKLIYISSDTVFDGEKQTGYHEYDTPNPVNVYGKSKLMAENEIKALYDRYFIVRTALLFGYKGHRENNFIYSILDKLGRGESIQASEDQICCPSYTRDLAIALLPMLDSDCYGMYHVANAGAGSRYEVSVAVAELAGLDRRMVFPVQSSSGKRAKRAKNTVFQSIAYPRTFQVELAHWRDALGRCMTDIVAREQRNGA